MSGVLIDTGQIAIAGATDAYGMGAGHLTVAAAGRLQIGAAGTLANAGTISNDGTVRLLGGGIGGAGTVINNGRMAGAGVIQAGTFTNAGVVVAIGGRLAVSGEIGSGAGAGTFVVQHGATLSLDGGIAGNEYVALAGPDARLQVSAATAGVRVISPQGGGMDVLGGGTATLNAQDTNLFVKLAEATNLTLSTMRFVTAMGSSGNDQITALASAQVLTGGLGTDTLTGAAATGDLFRDTAAGLNGDTLVNFAGTDVIDVTDIAAGGVSLGYQQNGATGTLSVSNGGTSTSITLAGSFTSDQFKAGSDGSGGVAIHLQG